MFDLPEMARLANLDGVFFTDLAQCAYGAPTAKPTTLLHYKVSLGDAQSTCRHASRWWRLPSTGAWRWGPHAPLKGKEWWIPADRWREHMLLSPEARRNKFRAKPFLTRQAAAYPAEMNRYLALKLLDGAGGDFSGRSEASSEKMKLVGPWRNVLVRERSRSTRTDQIKVIGEIAWKDPLKGMHAHMAPEDDSLGGLRQPRRAVEKVPGLRSVGRRVFQVVKSFIESDSSVLEACIGAIGSDKPDAGPSAQLVEILRARVEAELGVEADLGDNVQRVHPLRHRLLRRWAALAEDPDAEIVGDWLAQGAPAGINMDIRDPGVFPKSEGEDFEADGVDFVWRDPSLHENYTSVDNDEAAEPEVRRIVETGFVEVFKSLEACKRYLGAEPVTSKLAMVSKQRADGTWKRRLILDCRESQVSDRASRGGRLVLPRPVDIVSDCLHMWKHAGTDLSMEALVLDFTDWFYMTPLHGDEQRYFVTAYKGKYIVFLSQTQGSRNAPVVCGRVAALIGRLTQGMLPEKNARCHIYVDDPICLFLGPRHQRDLHIAVVICTWLVLGLRLAFKKAARGSEVTWVGYTFAIDCGKDPKVTVTGKAELMQEIEELNGKHLSSNVVKVRELRTFTGKANYVAGMIDAWRPFLADLYGVISSAGRGTAAPLNCVWTRQFRHASLWFRAFFSSEKHALRREFRLSTFLGKGLRVRIITDASPWGLGAILLINCTIIAFFSSALDKADEEMAGVRIGGAAGQQIWEALALLQAVKTWSRHWKKEGLDLMVSSDSVTALSLMISLRHKPGSRALGIIVKELALEFSRSSFRPRWHEHIPGVANDLADNLSRRFQPGFEFHASSLLKNAKEVVVPSRGPSFYTCLSAPHSGP